MKKWKIIRIITLALLICFLLFIGYIALINFLDGNYYNDSLGHTTYYWYDRAALIIKLFVYALGVPLIVDTVLLAISIIKISKSKLD